MLRKNPFIEPCQPAIRKESPSGPQWLHEVKFDGYRIQIHKAGKDVVLFSKNGKDFTTRFPDITHAIAALPTTSFILDAELTACSHDGSPDFSALLSKKGRDLCVWVFGILAQHGRDLRALSLAARRARLDRLMQRIQNPYVRYSETFADPHRLLSACAERKMEGIVSKRRDRLYVSGPTKDWIKVKCALWREQNAWRHDFFDRRR